jgi:hypothetical protein
MNLSFYLCSSVGKSYSALRVKFECAVRGAFNSKAVIA